MSKSVVKVEPSFNATTGKVEAVYFRVHDGEVAMTQEISDAFIYADYDRDGLLLGVEYMGKPGPKQQLVIERLIENEMERGAEASPEFQAMVAKALEEAKRQPMGSRDWRREIFGEEGADHAG